MQRNTDNIMTPSSVRWGTMRSATFCINQGEYMKITSLFKKAAVVATLAGAAFGAQAAVYDLGAISIGTPKSFNAGVAGNSVSFGDLFAFTLPDNGGSGYSVINFPLPFFGLNTVLSYASLFDNPDGIKTGLNGDETILKHQLSVGNAVNFTYGPSAAGSYFLLVSGITSGTAGGAYSGSISVTAVPEPESYAMLLAGLGVMGAIAMRRNKAKKD